MSLITLSMRTINTFTSRTTDDRNSLRNVECIICDLGGVHKTYRTETHSQKLLHSFTSGQQLHTVAIYEHRDSLTVMIPPANTHL